MFDANAAEKLGYYVYALFDPDSPRIPFYIGKGQGNRVFAHAAGNLDRDTDTNELSAKLSLIRDIKSQGKTVIHKILRSGLSEGEALLVEASLIDLANYMSPDSLRNEISGHGAAAGFIDAVDLAVALKAEPLFTDRPVLLIKIDRQWDALTGGDRPAHAVSTDEIYNAVRREWKISVARAQKAECVLAVARGLVRGAFMADEWKPASSDRVEFVGKAAGPPWSQFLGKSVVEHFPRGGQNPVRYLGC